MRAEIIHKLEKSLLSFDSEADVVYILTRIGKILEFDNKVSDYQILYFYRNWSVHAKLDKNKKNKFVKNFVGEFIKNKNYRDSVLRHEYFVSKLNSFLKDYSLPQLRNGKKFLKLLREIIADTPIILEGKNTTYSISLDKSDKKNASKSFTIKVTAFPNPVKINFSAPQVTALGR